MIKLNKGFAISIDHGRNIIKLQAWGAWDIDLAKKYAKTLAEKIKGLGTNGMNRYVLADFQDFSSQSEVVQRMVNCQFASARQQGIKKIGYIGEQSMIQLQFNELFKKRDLPQYAFFESEDKAIQWLIAE